MRRFNRRKAIHYPIGAAALLCIAVVCLLTQTTSIESLTNLVHSSPTLSIQLTHFSPAYAAFEDEYLFHDYDKIKPIQLKSGLNTKAYLSSLKSNNNWFPRNEISTPNFDVAFGNTEMTLSATSSQPTSSSSASSIAKVLPAKQKFANPIPTPKKVFPLAGTMNVSFGPMAIVPITSVKFASPKDSGSSNANSPSADSPTVGSHNFDPDFKPKKPIVPEDMTAGGSVELTGGLAFFGSMDVVWEVDGEVYERGQIYSKDGSYSIPIQGLTGQIVVSLYDESDLLIGEGYADIEELSSLPNFDILKVDIQISPINPSLAGIVKNANSIGQSRDTFIPGAEVSLFGFNVSSFTNNNGEYHFNQWENANSRTVAMVHKEGFWDSLFLLDSQVKQSVMLLSQSYMKSLFFRLQELGFDNDISQSGVIYGTISSKDQSLTGYKVEVSGHKTHYFQSHFIMASQTSTNTNGLFTIAGLEHGDYEIHISKDGALIDRRVVIVEEGKVSPLTINVDTRDKVVRFKDPLFAEPVPKMGNRFFDGEYIVANKEGRISRPIRLGPDPVLMDYATEPGTETQVFLSRNNNFAEVPVINEAWLKQLQETINLDVEKGVAFGFVDTNYNFRVVVAEDRPEQILYFDKKGQVVDNPTQPPAGFIIIGLAPGLHTLMLMSPDESELYVTDLVYNNGESISILNSKL